MQSFLCLSSGNGRQRRLIPRRNEPGGCLQAFGRMPALIKFPAASVLYSAIRAGKHILK